ncbi:MAG: hypothetical protein V4730_11800 [Pseudomonadota bacterium]
MAKISNRYATAVHSSNLKHTSELNKLDDQGNTSDADVLGAMGIADRRLSAGVDHTGKPTFDKHPLSVPLERLFAGDSSAGHDIVRLLVDPIMGKANALRISLTPVQAQDMARITLGWYRDGACKSCGGHGFKIIPGTKTLGDSRCQPCAGSGKIQLELGFRHSQRELVRWVMTQLEREAGRAGPAAMKALSSKMDL